MGVRRKRMASDFLVQRCCSDMKVARYFEGISRWREVQLGEGRVGEVKLIHKGIWGLQISSFMSTYHIGDFSFKQSNGATISRLLRSRLVTLVKFQPNRFRLSFLSSCLMWVSLNNKYPGIANCNCIHNKSFSLLFSEKME